jgi:hypothetical protein
VNGINGDGSTPNDVTHRGRDCGTEGSGNPDPPICPKVFLRSDSSILIAMGCVISLPLRTPSDERKESDQRQLKSLFRTNGLVAFHARTYQARQLTERSAACSIRG